MEFFMSVKRGIVGVTVVGLVLLLLSFAGFASDFVTQLLSNIDGLLLFAVCGMMALIFAVMLFLLAKNEHIIGGHKSTDAAQTPAAQK
jgi:hypothetical protein